MENLDNKNETIVSESLLRSAMLAATLSVALVVLLTVVGELYSPLKNFLKDSLYHHWVGKGVWSVALFTIVTLVAYPIFKQRQTTTKTSLILLNWALVLGSFILFFFFVYEYVIHH